MRILILTRTYPPDSGAVGHLVKELAGELARAGCQMSVVAGGGNAKADSTDEGEIRVSRVGSLPFSRQSHWKRALSYLSLYPAMLWAALRQPRPDVVVTTTDPPLQAVLGVILKVRFRCQLIHWCQDLYPEMAEEAGVLKKNGLPANLLRRLSTWVLQRHDRVISIGRCMTERLRERGVDEGRITEVANWTDPGKIVPAAVEASRFGQREGLTGKFVVAYSGNLGMAHTFTEILGAAHALQAVAPDVVFIFIGDGARRKSVETEAEKLKLRNIRFYPAQAWEDLADSLSAARLHLVTLRENMGGLVVPSKFYGIMAAGRPCLFIGPLTCEVARLIVENRVGSVIAPGADAGLADAILGYRNDPGRWQAESANARRLGEGATLEHAARLFLEITDRSP